MNHGAGPRQNVELHYGYHHFPYGLLKTKKAFQNMYTKKISRNLQKPKTCKRPISGSLGQDMSVARVAENSKGDRRCLDEICARYLQYMMQWNAYMYVFKIKTPHMFIDILYILKTKKPHKPKKQ